MYRRWFNTHHHAFRACISSSCSLHDVTSSIHYVNLTWKEPPARKPTPCVGVYLSFGFRSDLPVFPYQSQFQVDLQNRIWPSFGLNSKIIQAHLIQESWWSTKSWLRAYTSYSLSRIMLILFINNDAIVTNMWLHQKLLTPPIGNDMMVTHRWLQYYQRPILAYQVANLILTIRCSNLSVQHVLFGHRKYPPGGPMIYMLEGVHKYDTRYLLLF